jgi:hypothetical protein
MGSRNKARLNALNQAVPDTFPPRLVHFWQKRRKKPDMMTF